MPTSPPLPEPSSAPSPSTPQVSPSLVHTFTPPPHTSSCSHSLTHSLTHLLPPHSLFSSSDLVIMDDLQSELDVTVACQLSARGIAVIAAAHSRDLATLVHSGGELSAACGIAPAGSNGSRASDMGSGGRHEGGGGGGGGSNMGGSGGGMLFDSPSRSAPIRLGLPGFSSAVELQAAGEGAVSTLLVAAQQQRSAEAITAAAASGSVGLVVRVHHDIVASIKELLRVAGSPDHASVRNPQTSQLRYMDLATGRVVVQC
jgi:hypothetical protein